MLIGAMNHPKRAVLHEIEWMAELGLDFIDLTLEPPAAASWRVDVDEIRRALDKHELAVVGHTAHYLPLASPFEGIRRAAVEELKRCLEIFHRVGAVWMNIHPDRNIPLHERKFEIERNLESLRELSAVADNLGIGLMIENIPGHFNTATQLGWILEPMPKLGLHLDIGHCNLWMDRVTNTAEEILAAYGHRLRHVHLHDNRGGGADLHLPLGTGTLDVPSALRALRVSGYDGTITLEVFSPDRTYLAHSRDVLRRAWEEAGKEVRVAA
jgi:sugar phosphate isomerase/epimerase